MKKCLMLFFLMFYSAPSLAESNGGLIADASIGSTDLQMTNPDNQISYYKGYSVHGRGGLPLLEGTSNLYLTLNIGVTDAYNTANTNTQSEYVNFLYPGIGLFYKMSRLGLGFDYNFMFTRHRTVGTISRETNYSFNSIGYWAQYIFPLGNRSSLGLAYSGQSGTISKSQIKLSQDMPYSSSTFWIFFTYYSGIQLGELLGLGK